MFSLITGNDSITTEFYFSSFFPKNPEKTYQDSLSHLIFKKSAFFSLAK